MNVSKKRSLLKAVSWRIGGSVVTVLAVLSLTKDTSLSLTAGLLDVTVKFAAYYIHERVWNRIRYGRNN